MTKKRPPETPPGQVGFPNAADILMDAPIGIFTSTPEGQFLAANVTMARIFGYESLDKFIASVTDIASQLYADPDDREIFKRDIEQHGEVKVSIFTDSPMLQPMMMMFSNPMIAASSGAKLETHAGQRVIVDFSSEERRGEVNVVVANRILVAVEGQNVDKDELIAYLEAIDFRDLAEME